MTPHPFDEVEQLLHELLAHPSLSIAEQDRQEVSDFIDVGEYGLALEVYCASVLAQPSQASNEVRSIVKALAEMMEMNDNAFISRFLATSVER